MNMEDLKYPIGPYKPNKQATSDQVKQWIEDIESFPDKLNALIKEKSIEELNWPYRPDGWKVKQVIHHCADSHMNAFMRFKLALTENIPEIRPYREGQWAMLIDSQEDDLSDSLQLLEALHRKWTLLLRSLNTEQLELEYFHPQRGANVSLVEAIGNYSWHCRHHLAHVKNGLNSKGQYS